MSRERKNAPIGFFLFISVVFLSLLCSSWHIIIHFSFSLHSTLHTATPKKGKKKRKRVKDIRKNISSPVIFFVGENSSTRIVPIATSFLALFALPLQPWSLLQIPSCSQTPRARQADSFSSTPLFDTTLWNQKSSYC